jgi:hypothetical protein
LSVSALGANGTNVLAVARQSGLFSMTLNGISWSILDSGIVDRNRISSIVSSGNNIFAGIESNVYISINSVSSWSKTNSGFSNVVVSIT